MVDVSKVRVSRKTAAEASTIEVSKDADLPLESDIESKRRFRTPGFQRMRIDWRDEDLSIKNKARFASEERLAKEFADAFRILNWVYSEVRTPETDENGELKLDSSGNVVYKKNAFGVYEEDYSQLTNAKRDNLLFAISTRLFGWEQKSVAAWEEAMYAKAQWEERYSMDFDAPMSGTVQDREARGRKGSAEERYFAIFLTAYSRRVEAMVRDFTRIQDVLRQSLTRF